LPAAAARRVAEGQGRLEASFDLHISAKALYNVKEAAPMDFCSEEKDQDGARSAAVERWLQERWEQELPVEHELEEQTESVVSGLAAPQQLQYCGQLEDEELTFVRRHQNRLQRTEDQICTLKEERR
ncbi:unnamed protein product, partial [Amoebophrya sp. A120]